MCNSTEIHTHTAEFPSTVCPVPPHKTWSQPQWCFLLHLIRCAVSTQQREQYFCRFLFAFINAACVAAVGFFFMKCVILLQTLLVITSERVRSRWFKAGLYIFLSCILLHILFVQLFLHDLFINKQSEDHFSNCSPWIYRYRLLCACTRDYTIKSQVLAGNYTLYMFTCEAIIRWCGSECTPRVSRTKDKAGGRCINHLRVLVVCQKQVFSTNARLQHLYNCASAS